MGEEFKNARVVFLLFVVEEVEKLLVVVGKLPARLWVFVAVTGQRCAGRGWEKVPSCDSSSCACRCVGPRSSPQCRCFPPDTQN